MEADAVIAVERTGTGRQDHRLVENRGRGILACDSKCGAQQKLADASATSDRVTVRGSLIQRGRHTMMAVSNDADWITANDTLAPLNPGLDEEDLGSAELQGEILDAKCWFGAMRPNEGPVHKACAMLCVAGGIPPYFYARDRMGRHTAMMITDEAGEPLVQPILNVIADPVRAVGRLHRIEDLVQFRIAPSSLIRI